MEHLRDSEVVQLLEGALAPGLVTAAEQHVDSCPTCLKLLASAARAFSISREGALAPLEALPLARGALVGRYVILEPLGAGGMGLVYSAYDAELDRKVAVKILRSGTGDALDKLRVRVQREAQALARLNHPNVTTVYEVGTFREQVFIAMELVEGSTLRDWLRERKRSVAEVLEVCLQAGLGLAAAHRAGVVHRDFKPDNMLVGRDGRVRVTDFGVAHLERRYWEPVTLPAGNSPASDLLTAPGALMGTPGYMAPEQMEGKPADARADLFSFCVALYEALYGQRPFTGQTLAEVLVEIAARRVRPPPTAARVPARVRRPLLRGLEHDRDKRFASMDELLRTLTPRARRRRYLLLGAVAASAMAILFAVREARGRWVREQALPQIAQLVERAKYATAFELAEKVEQVAPNDPTLLRLWPQLSRSFNIETVPPGADVYVREYAAEKRAWRHLGRSPLSNVRLPVAVYRWRFEKSGYLTVDSFPEPYWAPADARGAGFVVGDQPGTLRLVLHQVGSIPAEMVHVPGGTAVIRMPGVGGVPPLPIPNTVGPEPSVRLGDYLIDRTEVTNKEFKRFVDAGGYSRRDLWQHEFLQDGHALPWAAAMALFRDGTDRPGPATWVSSNYPEGEGELPVTGVSWFEAAAYAAFVGKTLPTVYQWYFASGASAAGQIVPPSNFDGRGLAKVASQGGMGPFGTFDMAGNAKEWCWNASGSKRFILGGAWNEPSYMFLAADAESPFARAANFGFRLARNLDDQTPAAALDPLAYFMRDYRKEKPVSDDLFRVFKGLYAYDKGPLNAAVESADDTSPHWRKEKIRFAAAYGGEQVVAYLFSPRNAPPPHQTVVFFPGASAIRQRSSDALAFMNLLIPVIKSGRALLYPVYKSTYERGDAITSGMPAPTAYYRDHVLQWSKDLGRSIDYVATRNDLDHRRIAFYGLSWGAGLGPLLMAVEDRIEIGILSAGGLRAMHVMPEVDPMNFAPHVRKPILMVNGRHDFLFPFETAQVPFFDLLGSPAKDKRHAVLESGHAAPEYLVTKEVLEWLDRYLGPPG